MTKAHNSDELRKELDYKKMLERINKIEEDNIHFLDDMDFRRLKKRPFTQEESEKMSEILSSYYRIFHCIHCTACREDWMYQ